MLSVYTDVLRSLLQRGELSTDARILVLCGWDNDKAAFATNGFTNVVISNLESQRIADRFRPYTWAYQDAENITYPDGSFDFVVAHAGLHHCQSPHRALLEMYRVARKGVLFFEPYDNALVRLGVRLGIGQRYEEAAVFENNCKFGGVRNTEIPNYVYRWTEREITKVINSFEPETRHRFVFIHRMVIPWVQLRERRNRAIYVAMLLGAPFFNLMGRLFPSLCNNFAALILKPEVPRDLQPWLRLQDGAVHMDRDWLEKRHVRRGRSRPRRLRA